jgi:hypothetical protein
MAPLGHADPKVNLGIHAHVLLRSGKTDDRLDALVRGPDRGQKRRLGSLICSMPRLPSNEKPGRGRGFSEVGGTGLEPVTSCL